MKRLSLMERLHSKIEVTEGCWQWLGTRNPKGYGRFHIKSIPKMAHRVVYEALIGPIPDGMTLDHLCRNPSCVRPDHLEPVSNKENVLRGTGFAAQNAVKTHCPQGHEYSAENTKIGAHNSRQCRTCDRERSLRTYHRKKANG